MSSTPHSPPETPLKRAMAIDNEKLTRTRLPDEAPKGDSKGSMAPLEVTRLDGFANKVQVPATQPLEAPVPQDIQSDRNKMLQNHGDAEHVSTEDLKAELLPFDWEDLEKRYKKAVTEANDAENLLVEEFLQISESFSCWADASAQHDNDRAWKRIKTRQRYVQLSEQSLEEKKKHYVEVVEAFQKALQLLSR